MMYQRIAAHLAWIATMDPEYAKWARANYIALLKPLLAKSSGH